MATKYAVIVKQLPNTNGGTVDFTESGFGTPTGCLFFASQAYAVNPATQLAHTIGFFDGSNERMCNVFCKVNVSTTNTARALRSGNAMGNVDASAGPTYNCLYAASTVTDGVRLTLTVDNTGAERYCVCVMFGGDVSVDVGTIRMSDSNGGTASVTSLSYEPDVVLFTNAGMNARVNPTTHALMAWGAAVNDGSETQRAVLYSSQDNVSTSKTCAKQHTTRCAGQYYADAEQWSAELTAFASNGFTLTTRGTGASSEDVFWMALDLSGDSSWLGTLSTPTSPGDDTNNSPGFQPEVALNCAATPTTEGGTAQGVTFSMGATDGTTEGAIGVRDEDGQSTTDNSSKYAANVLNMIAMTDGADLATATFSSFGASGRTYNYGTVDGSNSYKGWELLIGSASAAASSPSLLASLRHQRRSYIRR